MTKLTVLLPDRLIGQRIDVALAQLLPDYSRAKLSSWIKSGKATLSGKTVKPKAKVSRDAQVIVQLVAEKTNVWLPENIPLDVVFADDDVLVINKPAGLVTHPGAGNWTHTLANALLQFDGDLQYLDRAGIVHRLDKNTSGLLVVARTELAQKLLVEQLQTHSVGREYSAIVAGHMISGGTIDTPIGRDPKDRIKQAVIDTGKEAITHYRVIERFKHHTHVKVILETGRTHQIRVHLAHQNHPLIGDRVYGGVPRFPKKADEHLKDALKGVTRQALHAKKLSFIHPNGERVAFKTPLPADFQQLLNILREFDAI